jgi:myo-inositol-1(or 4)-monophosphatase
MKLCNQITQDDLWPQLEQIAIKTVTAGGLAGMGYYRDAWAEQVSLNDQSANPSTMADLQATLGILRTCHSLLSPIAAGIPCALSYLGEETEHDDFLRHHLSDAVMSAKHIPDRFFKSNENIIRVIFDGIDGTNNFTRGLPLFCTAAAILVDDQVRVSAVYDPIHHEVYSATLPGPYENPESGAQASGWQVASGNRIDMVSEAKKAQQKALKLLNMEAIGIHLTRSKKNSDKLKEFLEIKKADEKSMLWRLAVGFGGIYALNSGIVAMVDVARGALGGFVNIVTNPWDVAAGEVLVRACGGIVTEFNGDAISYSSNKKVSVVAANKKHLHDRIMEKLK